jgi:hypothetical protein
MLVTALALAISLPSFNLPKFPSFRSPYASRVEKQKVAGWRIEKRVDRFTGQVGCRMTSDGMVYQNHEVRVPFPGFLEIYEIDVQNAVYRVDDRPAKAWADARWELVKTGSQLHLEDKTPWVSEVPIPADELLNAKTLSVRASGPRWLRTWDVSGFGQALEAARSSGCDAYAFRTAAP